jgi:RNA methyltransferase, TrmH family
VVRTGILAGAVPESLYVAAGAVVTGVASEGAGAAVHVAEVVSLAVGVGARVFELGPGVIERVASTVTPQAVLAVFPIPEVPGVSGAGLPGMSELSGLSGVPADAELVIVMAEVRDPGNAGTVLRTADAAGVGAVVVCGGTVDPYNPKTVRASAGSLFHVPIVLGEDPASVLDGLGASGFRRLGAVVRGGEDYAAVDWSIPTALVLGNEAWGLPDGFKLDGLVGIPMVGKAESLNVGMACAVLCFESLRQRRTTMPR